MRRILLLIAVLFAFASTGGAAFGYAAAGGEPLVRPASTDLCIVAETPDRIVAYKPCGKKRNGLAVLCPTQPLLLPDQAVCAVVPLAAIFAIPRATGVVPGRHGERQFRPPRA